MHVLLSKHSDFFDLDVVLDTKRFPKIDSAPWVQFLRVVDELDAQRILVQPFLSFELVGRSISRVDDGVFPGIYAFFGRGSPAIGGDATIVCQLGFPCGSMIIHTCTWTSAVAFWVRRQ